MNKRSRNVLTAHLAGRCCCIGQFMVAVNPFARQQNTVVNILVIARFCSRCLDRDVGLFSLMNNMKLPSIGGSFEKFIEADVAPVSYTHLTLPTIYSV